MSTSLAPSRAELTHALARLDQSAEVDTLAGRRLLAACSNDELRAVRAGLERLAPLLFDELLRQSACAIVEDALRGRYSTEFLALEFGLAPLECCTPEVWLASTPLVRALDARLR